MFLNPNEYTVLDMNIAKFGKYEPLFKDLDARKGSIPVRDNNVDIYRGWATWYKGIAHLVNNEPCSSLKDLRAVDVERGIYQLIGSRNDGRKEKQRRKDHAVARKLLKCPEGRSHEEVIELGRQLKTKN